MRGLRITERFTTKESSSFKQYLSEITQIKMFTTEEEEACSIRSQNGDKDAIDELVRRNLRFVVSVAKQYETALIPLEDLVNEGNIGLIIAAEKFNVSMGFKFISYAVFWVRKMIMEYLDKHSRLVRLPANKITSINKLNRHVNKLEQELGRNVDVDEIIYEMGENISDDEISKLKHAHRLNFNSLDSPISNSNGGVESGSHYDIIANDNTLSADHITMDRDLKKQIADVIKTLKPRDQKIMISLFGLDGNPAKSLKEVSEDVGLTREMLRQIKLKCLRQLRIVLA